MATNIDVTRERTVEHLNSKSVTAKLDQAGAKAVREKKAQLLDFSNWNRATDELRYPSLGGGLLLRADGGELSGAEHKSLLLAAILQLGYYFREEIRADGRTRQRKRKTKGVHSIVVTLRPDHAMLLAALERNPQTRYLVRPFLIQLARASGAEFTALTGLEVLAIEMHPEEGNLHLHITYATVSRDNRLLWAERTVGRKGLRCLGPWHVGSLRLALAGYKANPQSFLEWHRFRLLELAFGFWSEGRWNEEECADAHSWAFRHDPRGVGKLWECVDRDVENGKRWADDHLNEAPLSWLVRNVHPAKGGHAGPDIGQSLKPRVEKNPDKCRCFDVGGVGFGVEIPKGCEWSWATIAATISEFKRRRVSADVLKSEHSKAEKAALRCGHR